MSNRRLKKVEISAVGMSKFQLLGLIRKLPDNVQIEDVSTTTSPLFPDKLVLTVSCDDWDFISYGDEIPNLSIYSYYDDAEREKEYQKPKVETPPPQVDLRQQAIKDLMDEYNRSAVCHCDMEYTGMKTHYPNCPFAKK